MPEADTQQLEAVHRRPDSRECRLAVLLLGSTCILSQIGLSIAGRPITVELIYAGVALVGVVPIARAADRHDH
jgi:hypothetical protein